MIEFQKPKSFEDYLQIFREFRLVGEEPNLPPVGDQETVQIDFKKIFGEENDPGVIRAVEKWFESNSEDHSPWLDKNSGFEALAWYQPITFYQDQAGIFITLRGIRICGSKHFRALIAAGMNRSQAAVVAFFAAISQLLTHEIFHHDLEWMGFRFATTLDLSAKPTTGVNGGGLTRYAEYKKNVYRASLRKEPDGALEEALASANEYRGFPRKFVLGSEVVNYSKTERAAIKKSILSGFSVRPAGYKDGESYVSPAAFEQGMSNLLAWLLNPSQASMPNVSSPGLGIQKGPLRKHLIQGVTFVDDHRSGSLDDLPLALVVPDRSLKKLMRARGFECTGRGKGSHEVWARQGSPNVTVPFRKEHGKIGTLNSIAHSLGFPNAHELKRAIRSL